MTLADGQVTALDQQALLAPLEGALRAMSWGLVLLAAVAGAGQARLARAAMVTARRGAAGS